MSRRDVPMMFATGAVVSASTAIRVGRGWIGLFARRTPVLVRLTAEAIADGGDGRPEAALRDELIGLFREGAETSWRELRRGVDDLDALTRGRDQAPTAVRRYQVKP